MAAAPRRSASNTTAPATASSAPLPDVTDVTGLGSSDCRDGQRDVKIKNDQRLMMGESATVRTKSHLSPGALGFSFGHLNFRVAKES